MKPCLIGTILLHCDWTHLCAPRCGTSLIFFPLLFGISLSPIILSDLCQPVIGRHSFGPKDRAVTFFSKCPGWATASKAQNVTGSQDSCCRIAGERTNRIIIVFFRRAKSTPDRDTFEKCRDTPPTSVAIILQKSALLLAESSIYITNLYHDTAPIWIAILLQKY